jgi:hypothetical protein
MVSPFRKRLCHKLSGRYRNRYRPFFSSTPVAISIPTPTPKLKRLARARFLCVMGCAPWRMGEYLNFAQSQAEYFPAALTIFRDMRHESPYPSSRLQAFTFPKLSPEQRGRRQSVCSCRNNRRDSRLPDCLFLNGGC